MTLVMDAIGSFGAFRAVGEAAARGRLPRRSPTSDSRWYRLGRLNNRTHRELLVVDGRVAFAGGAGVADWWARPHARQADVARHDGAHRRAVVSDIQGIVAENWLECCGEILTGPGHLQAAPHGRRRRRRSR